jgi:cob(I)alamin adenosyltransferase
MKIYTKTGDQGLTGLFGGGRVSKDVPRIEAYGTVDELNAVLGVVRATDLPEAIDEVLQSVQHALFDLGAELATPDPPSKGIRRISAARVQQLESWIDQFEAHLAPLRNFILPGGTPTAAQLHLARTVCRRAERRLVTLAGESAERQGALTLIFLNRLSDLLFVLARAANAAAQRPDVPWQAAD